MFRCETKNAFFVSLARIFRFDGSLEVFSMTFSVHGPRFFRSIHLFRGRIARIRRHFKLVWCLLFSRIPWKHRCPSAVLLLSYSEFPPNSSRAQITFLLSLGMFSVGAAKFSQLAFLSDGVGRCWHHLRRTGCKEGRCDWNCGEVGSSPGLSIDAEFF